MEITSFEKHKVENNLLREFCWLHWDQNLIFGFEQVDKNFTKKFFF